MKMILVGIELDKIKERRSWKKEKKKKERRSWKEISEVSRGKESLKSNSYTNKRKIRKLKWKWWTMNYAEENTLISLLYLFLRL